MKIRINDRFFIEKDQYKNHTLKEEKLSKEGKPYTVVHGYFRDTESALTHMKHVNVVDNHERDHGEAEITLKEYTDLMKHQQEEIKKLLKGVE